MEMDFVFAFTVLLLNCLRSARADLNLYMDDEETSKLLGIKGELYYVRNGRINNYALNFNMPIAGQYDSIRFFWQSLKQKPAIYYNMAITVSNSKVINPPQAINISKDGKVPTKLTPFTITLPCTGVVSTEVNVRIHMNISIISASNVTQLTIKRKKSCVKKHSNKKVTVVKKYPLNKNGKSDKKDINQLNMQNTSYHITDETGDNTSSKSTSTNLFYIAVGCACALILFIAAIVAFLYIRSHKSSRNDREMSDIDSSQGFVHQSQVFLKADVPNNASVASLPVSIRRAPSTSTFHTAISRPQLVDPLITLREIQIERKFVKLKDIILEGTFGRVFYGVVITDEDEDFASEQQVYVKTVSDQARPDQIQTMLFEAVTMKGMSHMNINPLVAAVIEKESQPLLIYPHVNEGNLKKFLTKCRVPEFSTQAILSTQQLVYMAIHIVRGMQYLHRKKIVHRDIATRNCVIDSNLQVQMTDHALSRDLFPGDYHCLGDNENRPVKWLALESLIDRKFTTASDVWAFGVVLWELMTLGQQPYAEIDPFEMAAYLKEGYRAAQPINCPDELFSVMACCWALSNDERPKLKDLLSCLTNFYTALCRYV